MAQTAPRKLEIARRLYDLAVREHGLPPAALIFDPLTFTLATGGADLSDSAAATLEGIRLSKPNCRHPLLPGGEQCSSA